MRRAERSSGGTDLGVIYTHRARHMSPLELGLLAKIEHGRRTGERQTSRELTRRDRLSGHEPCNRAAAREHCDEQKCNQETNGHSTSRKDMLTLGHRAS